MGATRWHRVNSRTRRPRRGIRGPAALVATLLTLVTTLIGVDLRPATAQQANPSAVATPTGGRLVPLDRPIRIYDSRRRPLAGVIEIASPTAPPTPLGAKARQLVEWSPQTIRVANDVEVPTSATAVVLNVTVTDATSPGFLTVWPDGEPWPLASNLNFTAGETVANHVVVGAASNFVSVLTSAVTAEVIIDLFAYYVPDSYGGMVDVDPFRIADTREVTPLGPGESRVLLSVTRPTVRALLLNVTVTQPTENTFVAAFPPDGGWGGTSNLNVRPGQTAANMVLVPVGPSGDIAFLNGPGDTHVVVDVMGIYDDELAGSSGGDFTALTPTRVLDSRFGVGRDGPLGPEETMSLDLGPAIGHQTSAVGQSWALLNVTATEATAGSYLSVWASGRPRPHMSNLNPTPGRAIPNLVQVPVGADGRIQLYNAAGHTQVIADLVGFVRPTVGIGGATQLRASLSQEELRAAWSPPLSPRGAAPDRYRIQLWSGLNMLAERILPASSTSVQINGIGIQSGAINVIVLIAETNQGGVMRPGRPVVRRVDLGPGPWPPRVGGLSGTMPWLVWGDVSDATGYDVVAEPSDGGAQLSWWVGAPNTTTVLPGLRHGVRYHVFVRAVAPHRTSSWSPPVLVERPAALIRAGGQVLVGPATGRFFTIHSETGETSIFPSGSLSPTAVLQTAARPTAAELTPDERRLVLLSAAEQAVLVIDTISGSVLHRMPFPNTSSASGVVVPDNRYAIVGTNDNWVRLDLSTGATTPLPSRPDGSGWYFVTGTVVLSGNRQLGVIYRNPNELITFVEGMPQTVATTAASVHLLAANHDGSRWLSSSCQVLDGGLQVLSQLPDCLDGSWTADGRHLFRWDVLMARLLRVDATTGATVGEPNLLARSPFRGVLSGDWLATTTDFSDDVSFVDVRPVKPTPPAVPREPQRSAYGLAVPEVSNTRIDAVQEADAIVVPLAPLEAGHPAVGFTLEAVPLDNGPTLRISAPRSATELRLPLPARLTTYNFVLWVNLPNGVRVFHARGELILR